jgi:hypothetical protein
MKRKHKVAAIAVYILSRGSVAIGDVTKVKFPENPWAPGNTDPGVKSSSYNGTLYARDDDHAYYRDSNGVFWLIQRVPFLPSDGDVFQNLFHYKADIVQPGNVYGVAPGSVTAMTGTYSSWQAAYDGIDATAIHWRDRIKKPSGFPWWLLVVGAIAYKRRRR